MTAKLQGPGALPEWDLSDLYPSYDSPAFIADLEKAERDTLAFAKEYEGKIKSADGPTLAQAFERFEVLEDLIGRVYSFASLSFQADMSDEKGAQNFGNTQARLNDVTAHLIFFELELNEIADEVLEAMIEAEPTLKRLKTWIEGARSFKPYQLSAELEKILHDKSQTGRQAFNRLFDETMSSMTFAFGGAEKSVEEMLTLLSDPAPKIRADAAQSLTEGFKTKLKTFTLITNVLAKDKAIEDKWRGLPFPAMSRHLANHVEPEVVDALKDAVTGSYASLSHRYYALKAKWMGVEQMNFWDRNAPLPQVKERTIDWSEARRTVLGAYHDFSPKLAEVGQQFFDKPWIDAAIRPGKAPGAFSHGTVPSSHPYILLNYLGKPRDVMTLAHELGHGVHQCLAAEQGPLMMHAPLTLAETASVFGEMLTFRALLRQTTDPAERRALIASKVEDMINTVVRQIAFYDFELRLHDARKQGELTSEDIGALWMAVQAESLGPSITLNEGYEVWWTYIPHFIHSPFYVYSYAFGDCLVNALYGAYEEAHEGFAEKYLTLLKAGGSQKHQDLLKPFGLDASDPAFWKRGLSVISAFIDELEALDA